VTATEYRVTWTIDLDEASPEDAARQALEIQRNLDSWATHFKVRGPQGQVHEVDLGCPAEPAAEETVYVLVPMEEGIVRGVQAFATGTLALAAEQRWLDDHGLADTKKREHASDWGTGIALHECEVNKG